MMGLNVLRLAKWGLGDRLSLLKLCMLLKNEPAEARSRMAEVRRWEERVCVTENDLEELCMAV